MKTRYYLWLALFAFLFVASCQKAPELSVTGSTSVEIKADGGSSSVSFIANRDWTVSCSESWVHVSPSSGSAADGQITVTVRCDANTTYEDRSATITIKAEDLTQTISVRQTANLGIIVPTKSYDLTSNAKTIEIEVQSNTQYSVSVSDNWVKQTGTKGLTKNVLVFSVEENTSYDNRSATITIKPQNATVQEQVISVKQAQKDAMAVDKTNFDMPYGGGGIEVKVEANVSFDVTPNVDWIHYVSTKALSNSTVILTIDENMTYASREGKIEIKQKNGSLSHTVTVKQAGRIAVTSLKLNKTALDLKEGDVESLVATVTPDNATDKTVTWSSTDTTIATVDSNGKVKAIKGGSTTIMARVGDKLATCSVTVEKLPNGAVNLGLSVLWAECNLGASTSEAYGDYYAWGETETKTYYNWSTYKWCNYGSFSSLTKYNTSSSSGTIDNKTVLEKADDVAHAKLGDKWRMPTDAEWKELQENCTLSWTAQSGVKGLLITSNKNGTSVFLPAAGYKIDNSLYGDVLNCLYWSSSIKADSPSNALIMYSYSGGANLSNHSRDAGLCVRPVYDSFDNPDNPDHPDNPIPVSSVILNKSELILTVGESEVLNATVTPDNATDKTVTWKSSNTAIAVVDANGKVSAISSGSATIAAMAGEKSATCVVTVQPNDIVVPNTAVDMGVSVLWGSCNLGASSPEEYGLKYAWGESTLKEKYSWETYQLLDWESYYYSHYITVRLSKYNDYDKKTRLEPVDDAASVNLEGKWRMPTAKELDELIDNCRWEAINKNLIKATSKITGESILFSTSNSNTIKLWSSDLVVNSEDKDQNYKCAFASEIKVSPKLFSVVTLHPSRYMELEIRPVYDKSASSFVSVSSLSISETQLSLNVGETKQLKVSVNPANASDKTVRWWSMRPDVVEVSKDGSVYGIKYGSTSVVGYACGKIVRCQIEVKSR